MPKKHFLIFAENFIKKSIKVLFIIFFYYKLMLKVRLKFFCVMHFI